MHEHLFLAPSQRLLQIAATIMAPKRGAGLRARGAGLKAKKDGKTTKGGKKGGKAQGLTAVDSVKEPFKLDVFQQNLMNSLGVAPVKDAAPLKLATACSGSGAPSLVLRTLLAGNLREVMACELDPAAAHALMVNAKPVHAHVDVCQQATQKKCFCYVCNKACKVPAAKDALDLYVAGWPCNSNSLLNTRRFEEDPTTTKHADVLKKIARCLGKMQPRAFVLENVAGVTKKRNSQEPGSVAEWVKQTLKEEVPDYQIHDFMLGSHPVTSIRNRCYTIGVRDGSMLPIIKDVELLCNAALKMPLHHLDALLTPDVPLEAAAGSVVSPEKDSAAVADLVSKYAACFAKGARCLKSITFKPPAQRMSATMANREDCSPWLLSQIDLCTGSKNRFLYQLTPHVRYNMI